jgi:hypothetical protein
VSGCGNGFAPSCWSQFAFVGRPFLPQPPLFNLEHG